jgi:hypothetical protein
MGVVVAAHQGQRQAGMARPPGDHRRHGAGGVGTRRVQQVAQEDDFASAGGVQQRIEPLQRGIGGGLGHRHAETAERHRLADVRVGHQQQTQVRVAGGLLGPQLQAATAWRGEPGRRRAGRCSGAHTVRRVSSMSSCSVGWRRKPERA